MPGKVIEDDGEFRRVVFRLARHLKAVQEFDGRPVGAARAAAERWYDAARDVLPGRLFTEVWAELVSGWDKVRHAAGDDQVALAWESVQQLPLPRESARYDDPRVGRLIALCRELQRAGDQFFLSGERAGALLGVSQRWAASWLRMLVADGVLEVVDAGGGFRGGRRMARAYRCV